MDAIECWRCGRKNEANQFECGGCGIEEPWRVPNSSRSNSGGFTGSSASEDAWNNFAARQSPLNPNRYESSRGNFRSGFSGGLSHRQLASRLIFESTVAGAIFYVSAAVSTVFALGYFFFAVLPSESDGWAKVVFFLLMLAGILGAWLSIFLIVPFYTYMQMRAKEFQER